MAEISEKNIALVQEFINYQESFIKKLEGKNSNWDKFEHELAGVQVQLNEVLGQGGLVPKLARIELMESEIESLVEEVEDLKKLKEQQPNRKR